MRTVEFLHRLKKVRPVGDRKWEALCPAHDDNNASLSIREAPDGTTLVKCHAECNTQSIVASLGLTLKDLFTNRDNRSREIAACYDYTDPGGALLYQVVRFTPKDCRQRRPDGAGGWIWNLNGTDRVLYHLPAVRAAITADKRVFVLEGEKDVHSVEEAGFAATCNAGGAGKWRESYTAELRGAHVVVVTDKDKVGYAHSRAVAKALENVAATVELLEPAEGKDVSDHLAAGRRISDLVPIPIDPSPATGAEVAESTRPQIVVRPELNAMTDEAIAAINARSELGVYVRGRMLVRIARDGSARDRWLRRPPGAPVIVRIEQASMLAIMDDAASWTKIGRDKNPVPQMPPERIAKQILARLEWPFPYLDAVVEAPTMRPDGSLRRQPGWDPDTGLLYEPPPGISWPDLSDHPTGDDVQRAVELLLDPVRDFPFVAVTDRSAYLAAALTLLARHCIDGPTPLFPVRAPAPGTGKTLLADVVGLIGTGRIPAAMAMSYEAEEFRKRILALAVAGTACVKLDNASGSLGSDVLAAALTSTEWEDRILGQTEMVRVPLRTVWLATGNNLGFRRTLGRRVVPIDLDAHLEQPEDRSEFRHPDLLSYVRRERPRLVVAALTLLRAFHNDGRPAHGGSRMGSYEAWDDLVRSSIIWAGLDDPAGTGDVTSGRGRIREEADDDTEQLGELLDALARNFRTEAFTAASVMCRASDDQELRAIIDVAACPKKGGAATPTSLGATFREAKGRPVGGLMLVRHKRAWFVREIEA